MLDKFQILDFSVQKVNAEVTLLFIKDLDSVFSLCKVTTSDFDSIKVRKMLTKGMGLLCISSFTHSSAKMVRTKSGVLSSGFGLHFTGVFYTVGI